ncbi:hypothetical protein L0337_23765 [candidate division KSB1 bacterium]|nr:hypothetical protein [candidate division KSB1 bacterium]
MKRKQNGKGHQCACETCQQHPYSAIANEHRAINRLAATLDEKHRRRFVGLLALQWGRGSIQLLNTITGIDRATIRRGRAEVRRADRQTSGRVRRTGGGRHPIEKKILES